MAERDKVIVVDLDGTMYRGDGPVRVYAEALARTVPARAGQALLADLDSYLTGTGDAELAAASDAWVATRLAAERYGISPGAIQPAFLAARAALADGSCEIAIPAGLVNALSSLSAATLRVLVTNSPVDGLAELLARIGADDAVDQIVASADKPTGLRTLLPELAAPLAGPHRLLSLGDHWHNDLEPALAIGAVAFYVDTYDRDEGPAHARARQVEDLLPQLRAWAADPEDFVATHPVRDTTREGTTPAWRPSSSGAVSASSDPARS